LLAQFAREVDGGPKLPGFRAFSSDAEGKTAEKRGKLRLGTKKFPDFRRFLPFFGLLFSANRL
jgi:hypothetical protein